MMVVTNRLSKHSLYAVSRHSIPNFFADRDSKSSVGLTPLPVQNQTLLGGRPSSMFLDSYVIPPAADPD